MNNYYSFSRGITQPLLLSRFNILILTQEYSSEALQARYNFNKNVFYEIYL